MMECYLSQGVDVEIKNARGHTPFDMATREEIKQLVTKAIKTTKCSAIGCNTKFDFQNLRYYCTSSCKFYCKNCSERTWVFEKHDSVEKERPVCRSLEWVQKIEKAEENLIKAMDTNEFYTVDSALTDILN